MLISIHCKWARHRVLRAESGVTGQVAWEAGPADARASWLATVSNPSKSFRVVVAFRPDYTCRLWSW